MQVLCRFVRQEARSQELGHGSTHLRCRCAADSSPPLVSLKLACLPHLQRRKLSVRSQLASSIGKLPERICSKRVRPFLYADDISLACNTAQKFREAVITMDATFLPWGLKISTKKTKVLVVGRNAAAQAAEICHVSSAVPWRNMGCCETTH